MTTISIQPTFPNFAEADGTPLEAGYIYIGDANVNPETNAKTVYWDYALTIPASQPIRTIGGRPSRGGTPARLYINADYSMTVRSSTNTLVYSALTHQELFASAVPVESVTDLLGLTGTSDGERVELLSYATPNYSAAVPFDGAGGTFIWATTKPKSTADKIDVFDPSVSLANQGTGVGNGCWVRHNDTRMETVLTKAVGGAADVTLTETEASSSIFEFTGLLTASINVIVPDYVRNFSVLNSTTGAFTLTVKTSAGTGILVAQGESQALTCDGINVDDENSVKVNYNAIKAINTAKDTVAANATTSAIWEAAGNYIELTGTGVTITDFPASPQAGAKRRLEIATDVIFTDNANLDVQGGTQSLVAGDIAIIVAVTTTTFKVTIQREDGRAKSEPYALIRDEKADGVNGGTFTAAAWQTRDLNTKKYDSAGIASVAANQVTLQAGTYRFRAIAPCRQVNANRLKLYNVTDAADVIIGNNASVANTVSTIVNAEVSGRFTIISEKVFELRHYCQTTVANLGFGTEDGMALGVEVYSSIELWKET
jgi:hypothetical protein